METSSQSKGLVYDIQQFSIHDGPGIRTLVFFKGCPLDCWWCSNPESQSPGKEIIHSSVKCINCGRCTSSCPESAILWEGGRYSRVNREVCSLCGHCFDVCFSGGMKEVGTWYTVDELTQEVLKDEAFFRTSGGGITIGGGEPMFQSQFLAEFLQSCHSYSLHAAVETSGHAPPAVFSRIADMTDLLLLDLKHTDDEKHTRMTGVSNSLILENWRSLSNKSKNVVCRIPLIPGFNDTKEEIEAIGRFVLDVGCRKADLLPFHRLGEGKYAALDRMSRMEGKKPVPDELFEELKSILAALGLHMQVGN